MPYADARYPKPKPTLADKQREPVAWRIYADDGSEAVHLLYEHASAEADEWNWSIEPLYRNPENTGRASALPDLVQVRLQYEEAVALYELLRALDYGKGEHVKLALSDGLAARMASLVFHSIDAYERGGD